MTLDIFQTDNLSLRKYRNYTDEDIIKYAKEVKSIAALLIALGLRPVGGNYINIKRNLQRLNIETPHWTGQGWNKDKQLKNYKDYTRSSSIKKHLAKKRGYKCEVVECSITEWLGKSLVLEVDHIDGDRTNNEETNLMLLCPNCHSQTDTWRNRKRKVIWKSTWD